MGDKRVLVIVLLVLLGALMVAIVWKSAPRIHVTPTLMADLAARKECCESSVRQAKAARPFPARRQGLTLQQGESKYNVLQGATAGLIEYLCQAIESGIDDNGAVLAKRTRSVDAAGNDFSSWASDYISAQDRQWLKNRATGRECCAASSGGIPLPELIDGCNELVKIVVAENVKAKKATKATLRSYKLRNWDTLGTRR